MDIDLPIYNENGKQVNKITLIYEYSKYVHGLDLAGVLDIDGKHMMMHVAFSGNGITQVQQFIGKETLAACVAIEVGTHKVYVPKYLSFLGAKIGEKNDNEEDEFVG